MNKLYQTVCIEKNEKDIKFNTQTKYPIHINHDKNHLIGYAKIKWWRRNSLYADLHINIVVESEMTLYPSIGYSDGELREIGLCSQRNVDETINPIKIK